MKKTVIALICAASLLLWLSACGSGGKSESGAAEENGVAAVAPTPEVGGSVGTDGIETDSQETVGSAAESPAPAVETEPPEPEADGWAARFSGGAIGENGAGDQFLFAWDDRDDMGYAALAIISADGGEVLLREGSVALGGADDNVYYVLTDAAAKEELRFNLYPSVGGDFDLFLRGDADTAVMNEMEYDTVIGAFAQVIG